jgi:putative transposase
LWRPDPVNDSHEGNHAITGYAGCEVVEMNGQEDHIHVVVMVPPRVAISDLMGRVKGQTAIKCSQLFFDLTHFFYTVP